MNKNVSNIFQFINLDNEINKFTRLSPEEDNPDEYDKEKDPKKGESKKIDNTELFVQNQGYIHMF